ncbi:MAG: carboxypeptidase regulatory-like domain-containing protein [Bacteroidales bacterium]
MKKVLLNLGLAIILVGVLITNTYGQVTTSGLKGLVVDEKKEALAGATIVAVHVPSGTQYGVLTNKDGRFTISNMRVGGPYQVTVSFIGYKQEVYSDINLSLGNVTDMVINLSPSVTSLSEVIVTAGKNSIINSGRTGAAINVSNETVNTVPTISRGLKDFTKISPLANTSGSGTSFAGANNRYNQFAIDGLVNNDVFGLTSSGTNGGQAGIEPISLDAIEEFQINIAPYDVRQGGFTGGGINAITKSGTNKFTGTAYYYGNNENLVGKYEPKTGTKSPVANYSDYQGGFSLGGPIVKNKVFFFVSGEITRKSYPLSNVPGTATSNITLDDVNNVLAVLNRVAPNYDPGSYLNINSITNSNKILAKVNWNINDKNKLILRHSYTYGENFTISRNANALQFYNNGYIFPSTTNSTGLELSSILGNSLSNRFMLGYTSVVDDRNPVGADFPTVLVNLSGGRTITFGSEYSSVANLLKQKIFSLDDEFSIFRGKHSITIGTHNEFYSFYNLFVQNIFGDYAYNSLANFQTVGTPAEVAPTYYAIGYSFDTTDNPSQSKGAAKFKASQFGFYAQDEYQIMKNMQITGGLRIDIPVFPDKPGVNDAFNTAYATQGVATGVLPKSRIMWGPRFGFNWDVFDNRTTQVRGGSGLFTGRVPFVWISNQYSNNGELNGTYSVGSSASSATPITNPAGLKFDPDPYTQPLATDLGKVAGRGAINVVDKNLKFPQVFRTNLAIDQKLPWGVVATIEGIYSKTFNNVNFIDLNRTVDPNFQFTGVDQRPRYLTGRFDQNFDEIIKFENTSLGYSYNFVFQLQKQFDNGFNAQVSYTFGRSTDLNSGTSSVAYSNWRYVNNIYGPNFLELTRSNFDLGSRITGLISYKKDYLKGMLSTQVSLFYNGQSGQPLSYIYNGDMNNDGTTNDMIFIPAKQSDINLITIPATASAPAVSPADQWTALDAFISHDKYLNSHRGQYAQRNAARSPWQNQFDFQFLQEFKVKAGTSVNKLQVTFAILNVGNMLNKKWGHSIYASNQQFNLINYKGLTGSTPNFTYDASGQTNGNPYLLSDLLSRWRGQIGLRYIFN